MPYEVKSIPANDPNIDDREEALVKGGWELYSRNRRYWHFRRLVEEHKATTAARKLAQESNIDLSQVEGTGAGHTIVKADVERHLPPESQTD